MKSRPPSEYQRNLERAVEEFHQGNVEKSAEYMDRNYVILFKDYNKIGDVLSQVREKLKHPYLKKRDKSALLDLLNSLNQLFTLRGDKLREYSELQQTGEIPTNCPE